MIASITAQPLARLNVVRVPRGCATAREMTRNEPGKQSRSYCRLGESEGQRSKVHAQVDRDEEGSYDRGDRRSRSFGNTA